MKSGIASDVTLSEFDSSRLEPIAPGGCYSSKLFLYDKNFLLAVNSQDKARSIPESLDRRIRAHNIFRKYLPNYTMPNEFFLTSGFFTDSYDKEATFIVKKVKYLKDVRPITTYSIKEIFGNYDLCRALLKINVFSLIQGLFFARHMDLLRGGNYVSPESFFGKVINTLATCNVFTYDNNGKLDIFCDSDYYVYFRELKLINRKLVNCYLFYNFMFAKNVVVYGVLVLYHFLFKKFWFFS